MTHDELLALLKDYAESAGLRMDRNAWLILADVVEYHKPYESKNYGLLCGGCDEDPNYPCGTIRAIEKELK